MANRHRGRRKRREERRAQTNNFFAELARGELEHKDAADATCTDYVICQALLSQGTRQSDITFNGFTGLKKSFVCCPKIQNHEKFIPVTDFSREHLPRQYQDKDIHDCVKRLSTLCVILRVGYTSESRPRGYPFSELAGSGVKKHDRIGSGSAFIPRKRRKGPSCPCQRCKESSTSSKNWYYVWVSTALHVVFDNLEAVMTEIGWQFNDSTCRHDITWMQGLRLVNFDLESDRCIVECVTHDVGIRNCIRSARSFLRHQEKKLNEKYAQCIKMKRQPLLAVIVSHPHGYPKQVSLGTDIKRVRVKDKCPGVEWTEYLYDTPTCRGSSGALVWLLGQTRVGYRDRTITSHMHSGSCNDTINMSGGGLDLVTHHTSAETAPETPLVISPRDTSHDCRTQNIDSVILQFSFLIIFVIICNIVIS